MLSKYQLQIIKDNDFSLGKKKKLIPNLGDKKKKKKKYKLHYQKLKLYLNLFKIYLNSGLLLRKIHRT